MQSEHQQLITWVGGPTRRAPRIPKEVWEGFKNELELLYQRVKLDELMEYMEREYSFTPTYVTLPYSQDA